MDSITYAEACERLGETIERVCRNHAPVVITGKRKRSVVLLSLEDYNNIAMSETAYLLQSRKNARRLLDAIEEMESGRGESGRGKNKCLHPIHLPPRRCR